MGAEGNGSRCAKPKAARDTGVFAHGHHGDLQQEVTEVLARVSLRAATMQGGGPTIQRQEKGEFNHRPRVRDRERVDRRERAGF
ncbi:MAG: hypothetical protein JWR26_3683 [Pedosphaera sp.]|nr:hypothetical protein [Pedosphaera sp.]